MKKLIAIFMIVILSFSVLIGCGKEEKNSNLEDISNAMMSCNSRKAKLENELKAAWEEYDERLSGGESCFVLFFDNMSSNLMNEVFPLVSGYGYRGTVVMSDGEMPGAEECITKADYDKLLREGWDFAIGSQGVDLKSENSVENLRAYLEDYKNAFDKLGLEYPSVFAFSKNEYKEKYTDLLLEYGFKVVRHFGGAGNKFSYSLGRNGIYLLASGIICSDKTTMKADMLNAYNEQATFSATVRYVQDVVTDESIDCSKLKYDLMLEFLEDECEEANVFTATELYNYKANTVAGSENYMQEFNERIQMIEQSIEEVDVELEKLRETLLNND